LVVNIGTRVCDVLFQVQGGTEVTPHLGGVGIPFVKPQATGVTAIE